MRKRIVAGSKYPNRFKKGHVSLLKGLRFNDNPNASKWTPELRRQKKLAKLEESKEKFHGWTEEKRQAARARILARNEKAKEEAERLRRRRLTRYIRNKNTGEIYVWTEFLEKRSEFEDLGVLDPLVDLDKYRT